MRKFIMAIGIPGAGKTTFLKKFAEKYHYAYLCPDEIRFELYGDEADQSHNKEVWYEFYSRLDYYLSSGKTVILDATFTNHNNRRTCIKKARNLNIHKIQGLYFDIPLAVAKSRNKNRSRIVPDVILEEMYESLANFPPVLEEGFDSIITFNENKLQDRIAVLT